MFDIPLLQACVQQQKLLEEMVKPPMTTLERDSLAAAVQMFASHVDLLHRTQSNLHFKAGKTNHPETAAIGSMLSALIQAAIARGNLLRTAVEMAGKVNDVPVPTSRPDTAVYEINGHAIPVDRAQDLDKSLSRLANLLDIHERNWPHEPVPNRAEALKADNNSESQPLDVAFAEAAGLDLKDWNSRVEEHRRRKLQPAGG